MAEENGVATQNGSADPVAVENTESKSNEDITVFHDPDNFNVKHPLQNEWTLWFTKPPSGKVRGLMKMVKEDGVDLGLT